MTDAATIKAAINNASWNKEDDIARGIVNSLRPDQIKALDAEAVLRLTYAIGVGGWITQADIDALKRLKKHTQFQPVSNALVLAIKLLKNSAQTPGRVKTALSEKIVKNIYAAEAKRLSRLERWGIDGDTIGRGQLSQAAYTDVIKKQNYLAEFRTFINHIMIPKFLDVPGLMTSGINFRKSSYEVFMPPYYSEVILKKEFEDFVVAAYLAIKFKASFKNPARSDDDAKKFGVAVYHGMYNSVRDAQKKRKDDVNWAPIEAELKSSGSTATIDAINYIYEVVK